MSDRDEVESKEFCGASDPSQSSAAAQSAADYAHWLRREGLKVNEAVALLAGLEPGSALHLRFRNPAGLYLALVDVRPGPRPEDRSQDNRPLKSMVPEAVRLAAERYRIAELRVQESIESPGAALHAAGVTRSRASGDLFDGRISRALLLEFAQTNGLNPELIRVARELGVLREAPGPEILNGQSREELRARGRRGADEWAGARADVYESWIGEARVILEDSDSRHVKTFKRLAELIYQRLDPEDKLQTILRWISRDPEIREIIEARKKS